MRWVSLGSIGLIAFMGCTGPVAAQQTQSRPKPKRGATRALVLASAALATGIFAGAGAMVNPQTAQAACNVPQFPSTLTPINVTCPAGTTTTVFSQYPDSIAFGIWRIYPGTLSAQIDQGATVNGFGLNFVAAPGAALTVTNQGRVTTAEVGFPDGCCAALFIPRSCIRATAARSTPPARNPDCPSSPPSSIFPEPAPSM